MSICSVSVQLKIPLCSMLYSNMGNEHWISKGYRYSSCVYTTQKKTACDTFCKVLRHTNIKIKGFRRFLLFVFSFRIPLIRFYYNQSSICETFRCDVVNILWRLKWFCRHPIIRPIHSSNNNWAVECMDGWMDGWLTMIMTLEWVLVGTSLIYIVWIISN